MKYTILLRLQAPMQAWGTSSLFNIRDTLHFPTKSGLLGLLAAAMGFRRGPLPEELCVLGMGVKVLQSGLMMRDFHTALNVIKADGGKGDTVISDRYYLHDAWFVAGLTSSNAQLLTDIFEALQKPHWPLYLGRRSCPPSSPVSVELPKLQPLFEALLQYSDPLFPSDREPENILYIESGETVPEAYKPTGVITISDQPTTNNYRHFLPRQIVQYKI